MYYFVTHSKKPTSSTCAILTTSPDMQKYLLLAKGNYLQMLRVNSKSLEETCISNLIHQISCLTNYKRKYGDVIIVLLSNMDCLCFTIALGKLSLIVRGKMKDMNGKPREEFSMCVGPSYLAVALYEGCIKIVPIKEDQFDLCEPFLLRTKYEKLVDMCFVPNTPYLALLVMSPESKFYLKIYSFSSNENQKCMSKTELKLKVYYKLVMKDMETAIIFSFSGVSIYNGANSKSIDVYSNMKVCAVEQIDDGKILFGCENGSLYMAIIKGKFDCINLGTTSRASSIAYVDDKYAFISSVVDSLQLIKLPEKRGEPLEIVREYENICTINDMRILNNDAYLVSGEGKSGCLRKLCKGVSVNNICSIAYSHIKKLWAFNFQNKNLIIISQLGKTTGLQILNNSIVYWNGTLEKEIETLHCGKVCNSIIQVFEDGFYIVSDTKHLTKAKCSLAAFSDPYFTISYLYTLSIYHKLKEVHIIKLKHEASAIAIHKTSLVICYWQSLTTEALDITNFSTLFTFQTQSICTSLLVANITGTDCIYIGQTDGIFSVYDIESKRLINYPIATQEINLQEFVKESANHLMITSDIPYIVYSQSQELNIAQLNYPTIGTQW